MTRFLNRATVSLPADFNSSENSLSLCASSHSNQESRHPSTPLCSLSAISRLVIVAEHLKVGDLVGGERSQTVAGEHALNSSDHTGGDFLVVEPKTGGVGNRLDGDRVEGGLVGVEARRGSGAENLGADVVDGVGLDGAGLFEKEGVLGAHHFELGGLASAAGPEVLEAAHGGLADVGVAFDSHGHAEGAVAAEGVVKVFHLGAHLGDACKSSFQVERTVLAVSLGVFVRANSLVGHLQAKEFWDVSRHCVLHKSGAAVAHGIESVSVQTTSEQLGGMGAITESTLEVTKSLIDFAAESIMVNVANGYDNHAVSEKS